MTDSANGGQNGAAPAPLSVPSAMDIQSLVKSLSLEATGDASKAAAAETAAFVKRHGILCLAEHGLLEKITAAASTASATPMAREGAMRTIAALAEVVGVPVEPYLVPLVPAIIDRIGDKVEAVREAADAAGRTLMSVLSPHAVAIVMPMIVDGMDVKRNWQTKRGAMMLVRALQRHQQALVTKRLPILIPLLSELMVDAKLEVKNAAVSTMRLVCDTIGNRDIMPLVPELISCIAQPLDVPTIIEKLSATTFVQSIDAAALSILIPLLVRGLRERVTAIKRKSAVIIDNMAKLVENPHDAHVFLPRLLPGMERLEEEVADPECRSVASKAVLTLKRVGGTTESDDESAKPHANKKDVIAALHMVLNANSHGKALLSGPLAAFVGQTLEHVAALVTPLIDAKNFDLKEWTSQCVGPFLAAFLSPSDVTTVAKAFLGECFEHDHAGNDEFDDDEGEDLCNCEFSLAYGGKILLNGAKLRLKRGRRYGLCGANGAGKSTLMKAIAAGKLDGFPPEDQLRTVYVEHDIQASLGELAVVEFVFNDAKISAMPGNTHEHVEEALASVGFDKEMQAMPVTSISGGWKMKLALARAMLLKADILLLDEPTNHLDFKNVAWLEHYLTHQPSITCMVVSHDSGFLDNVCTDIIHYESRQLKLYKGNLSEFVKVKPEAQSYYELAASTTSFTFPEPGLLDGVTSKEKPILKLTDVSFTYPGASKPQLTGVDVKCALGSRVAVLGVNGAGKSTLIRMMTGETKPQVGLVYKHPNLRVAYVAQHAFHHLENHLDTTPNRYLHRRYAKGEDKEESSKVTRVISEEEEKAMMRQVWMIDGQPRILDHLCGRRKKKRSWEYEVAWQGLTSLKYNRWIPREELEEKGFLKLINKLDSEKAANALGDNRPLTQESIEKYLQDFGLDPEFGTHSNIRGLSGGQKVKLVLAAAMWNNPHMLIMDEPTNYLDRDSLGALAAAIKKFNGGVVIISHHAEFTNELCTEQWNVADGKVTFSGEKPHM